MRTLVTGGAGFLGSTLVDRLLAEGHAVDVIDDLSTGRLDNLKDARADRRNELAIHHVDLRQADVVELIERREPEVVFHLASRPSGDDALEAEVTLLSTLRVLEGARRAGARKIVFASSASVYGIVDDEAMPVRESQPQRPVTIGAVAKKAAVDAMSAYREVHGIEFTALALSTVYGPRDERSPVAVFGGNLRAGRPTTISGDGRQTRDLLYVDDAVDAFVRAAERGSGLLVNIATGVETSILDLFRLTAKAAGMPNELPMHEQERRAERRRVALDAGRARIHLGWSSWTTLEEGVADTLAASAR
jgi:UDP-glucose 4-epimerase